MPSWIFLVFAVVCNITANLFVKQSNHLNPEGGLTVYLSPWFIVGLGLYGINLISYTKALNTLPISVAYPSLVGGTMTGICILAALLYGETLTVTKIAGMASIFVGIYLLSS